MFFLFSAKHCEPFFRFRSASWGLESEQGGRHIGEREREREKEREREREREERSHEKRKKEKEEEMMKQFRAKKN